MLPIKLLTKLCKDELKHNVHLKLLLLDMKTHFKTHKYPLCYDTYQKMSHVSLNQVFNKIITDRKMIPYYSKQANLVLIKKVK